MEHDFSKSYDHIETEKEWYRRWEDSGLFKAENGTDRPAFSVILPPPNVTGSLHIGHALTLSLPDIIIRRKKMLGFNVLWLPGIDHAGIATQMVVERWLKAEKNQTKEDLGREKFLELLWSWKETSEKRIVEQVKKLGLSLDWTRMKFTFSEEMQVKVRKVFVELFQQGKIYQGVYMVNRCPRCQTVLSDLEVEHKEIQGQLTFIRYPLKDDPEKYIVVATTRPETMLGDTAVAVHPRDRRYRDWIGKEVLLPLAQRPIPVIADEGVEKEFGTGAVKVTPAHDPFDYELGIRHHLPSMKVIDENGRMSGDIPGKYSGLDRLECRRMVLTDLQAAGLIEKTEVHVHAVGHCQRCETVVEPSVSKQWFMRMPELAKPAIGAVHKKAVVFIPEKWEKVYFNWMENIQDWCISRQLWWGHRIPAFYCCKCGAMTVSEDPPQACTECGHAKFQQEEDVLDTWFSSALWPFITLGWPDPEGDFKIFYPTSIMATGFDIIFFWVARMVMMGIHFCGDVPFREVLINGLIRDEKGQKMSKTKNNIIDPLEIIEEYGADALRFTLAIQAVPGMDISLSVARIKGYRAFANKLWNASRFVIMNMKGDEGDEVDLKPVQPADRWILHLLNLTTEKVNGLMEEYRLFEAADLIYHFIWDEFCDWYLEFSKADIESVSTRRVLKWALIRILQLLHPFMPYITEEIFRHVDGRERFIVQTDFPQFLGSHVFLQDFDEIEFLKKMINETRKTRTENNIDPNRRVKIYLKCDDERRKNLMKGFLKYFDLLTRSQKTEIRDNFTELGKGFKGVILNWEILLPFENEADWQREVVRLKGELRKTSEAITGMEKRLAGPGFQEKAPAEVVQNLKKNLMEAHNKKEKIGKTLEDLS